MLMSDRCSCFVCVLKHVILFSETVTQVFRIEKRSSQLTFPCYILLKVTFDIITQLHGQVDFIIYLRSKSGNIRVGAEFPLSKFRVIVLKQKFLSNIGHHLIT